MNPKNKYSDCQSELQKKTLVLYFLISLITTASPFEHDFKMSVCEMVYDGLNQQFEVRYYLFQDDLKEVVYGDPFSAHLEEEKVVSYILEKTKIKLADKYIELKYKELKEKEDQVLVTFTSGKINITDYSTLFISNQIMIEKFRTQTNLVYVILPNRPKWTQILNAGKTKAVYEF